MPFEHYIQSGGKRLRCGYTTGTCAALAAAGAARLLLGGRAPESVTLTTPGGLPVTAAPRYCRMAGETACCAVEKDGGDDIDATHGALIEARVERAAQPGVVIDGGPGVGRVTKPGLDQPVGAAAINRVPRRMIEQAVRAVCDALNWDGGLRVTICVPEGAALAKKTFNPQLGIEGGISILGTSGIVEPMSMQALIDTVALSLRQARAQGAARVLLTPGNYGVDFLREQGLDAAGAPVVKCSNFIGDALDEAAALGFAGGRRHEYTQPICGLPHGAAVRPRSSVRRVAEDLRRAAGRGHHGRMHSAAGRSGAARACAGQPAAGRGAASRPPGGGRIPGGRGAVFQ